VYNIQKAVSRLDFAPNLKQIQITDIKKGIGVFTPKPDKLISFADLQTALKKAGYVLDSAELTVSGTLIRENNNWWLVVNLSGQRFALENGTDKPAVLEENGQVEITGAWKSTGAGSTRQETLSPSTVIRAGGDKTVSISRRSVLQPVQFQRASFNYSPLVELPDLGEGPAPSAPPARSLAPIRTTSPGLTVYKGGAVVPRFYYIRQHLGDLEISRQVLDLSISYTPTQRVQLEAEVPIARTAFNQLGISGDAVGLGNVTLWTKYRFYRTVKTYGDRQASFRVGLELPTGTKTAPGEQEVKASEFVRQQLTPISGGLAPHFEATFSQAGGRFIFGGDVEGVLRSERSGFRTGHEIRVDTDLEYVLLPREYPAPGGELFVILESSFVHRGLGRSNSLSVPGSNSTEYYLAPGLQYAANPRFVVEGSYQFPVVRNTGPQLLRTDRNILFGVRYLF
jgi:hypothetical protein